MNIEAQNKLKQILKKEVHELTPHDKEFMRARRDYIGRKSRAKFAEILDIVPLENQVKEVKQKLVAAAPEIEAPEENLQPPQNEPDLNNPYEQGEDDEELVQAA